MDEPSHFFSLPNGEKGRVRKNPLIEAIS